MRRWFRFGALAAVVVALSGVPAVGSRVVTAATPYPGGRWKPLAEPLYGVHAVKNVRVPMSDGATLTVDVYYPADLESGEPVKTETFPVLLTQTPYTGSLGAAGLASSTGPGAYFVERG